MNSSFQMPARVRIQGKPAGCKLLRLALVLVPATVADSMQTDQDAAHAQAIIGLQPPKLPVIHQISIHGDFFAVPEEEFDAVERELAGTPLAQLGNRFDTLIAAHGIELAGISGAGLDELIRTEAPWLLTSPASAPQHPNLSLKGSPHGP